MVCPLLRTVVHLALRGSARVLELTHPLHVRPVARLDDPGRRERSMRWLRRMCVW